jgi:hydroxylysine kinase
VVRLLRFEPGEILYSVVATPALCLETGSYLARLDTALEGFSHEAYNTHTTIWALSSATKLPQFLYALKDPSNADIVRDVLVHFEKDVISTMPSLRKGNCN